MDGNPYCDLVVREAGTNNLLGVIKQNINLAQRLNRADQPARCAYLELCEPTLLQAASELAQQGCSTLVITPMFLGLGQHARTDIPVLSAQLQRALPEVQVLLRPALCDMPGFIDVVSAMLLGQLIQIE